MRELLRRWGLGIALAAATHASLLVTAAPAWAQDPSGAPAAAQGAGNDVVVLKNGGMLRGTLIEVLPGTQARVQLPNGTIATVPWTLVDHIERTSGATTTTNAPPADTVPAGRDVVWVTIESDNPVNLQRIDAKDDEWRTVCTSPCNKAVPLDSTYRVTGEGTKTSPSFHITAEPNQRVLLTVTPRSGGLFALGIVCTVLGGIGIGIGLLMVLIGAVTTDVGGSNGKGVEATGWGVTAFGVAGLVGGILLITGNSKTKIDQEVSAPRAEGMARLPSWKEIGSAVPTLYAPASQGVSVPLLRF